MLILGIDDAGRGPLIGPMVLAGVLIDKKDEQYYKKHGVNDSKQLTPNKRTELAKYIETNAKAFHVVMSSPEVIDKAINTGVNLNTLEAMKTAEIINEINNSKMQKEKINVIVDCPSTNINAWLGTLLKYVENKDNLDVACEHKADANHIAVSAASILAKVSRDSEVEKLKKKYGDLGSGYPSDPITVKFLHENGAKYRDSGIFRKSWATWKELFPEKSQATLGEFK
jgi:ribonuclease HII